MNKDIRYIQRLSNYHKALAMLQEGVDLSSLRPLSYPDFFKVGVAASGNYDSRLYGSFWGEKYEGMPDETDYQEQVTGNKASNMSGKLLLLTGDMDDNVHPSMTTQLEENLITANKSFDMFIFPGKNHDLNYDPDYMRKMMGYFVKHL